MKYRKSPYIVEEKKKRLIYGLQIALLISLFLFEYFYILIVFE
jgi:hypothetical protein